MLTFLARDAEPAAIPVTKALGPRVSPGGVKISQKVISNSLKKQQHIVTTDLLVSYHRRA